MYKETPDEHWLLVKKYWTQIEYYLKTLVPTAEDNVSAIDSLNDRLTETGISTLHYLRKERNALLHENKALSSAKKWERKAEWVLEDLKKISVGKKPKFRLSAKYQWYFDIYRVYLMIATPLALWWWIGAGQHSIPISMVGFVQLICSVLVLPIALPLALAATWVVIMIMLFVFSW